MDMAGNHGNPPRERKTQFGTYRAAKHPKDVAATIRRIARTDRHILKALAAFDRGGRPTA
jgi:hypothetical protein